MGREMKVRIDKKRWVEPQSKIILYCDGKPVSEKKIAAHEFHDHSGELLFGDTVSFYMTEISGGILDCAKLFYNEEEVGTRLFPRIILEGGETVILHIILSISKTRVSRCEIEYVE